MNIYETTVYKSITITINKNDIKKHLNCHLVTLNLGKSNCIDGDILSILVQKNKYKTTYNKNT